MRNVLAVVSGFIIWTVLWLTSNVILIKVFPKAMEGKLFHYIGVVLGTIIIISVFMSIIAGAVTAKIASSAETIVVLMLAFILLAVGIVVELQNWSSFPVWYHICFLGFIFPSCILGRYIVRNT